MTFDFDLYPNGKVRAKDLAEIAAIADFLREELQTLRPAIDLLIERDGDSELFQGLARIVGRVHHTGSDLTASIAESARALDCGDGSASPMPTWKENSDAAYLYAMSDMAFGIVTRARLMLPVVHFLKTRPGRSQDLAIGLEDSHKAIAGLAQGIERVAMQVVELLQSRRTTNVQAIDLYRISESDRN